MSEPNLSIHFSWIRSPENAALVIFDAIASRKLHLRRLAPVFLQLDFVAQLEALHLVEVLDNSGTIVTLPIKWAEVRREAKQLTD